MAFGCTSSLLTTMPWWILASWSAFPSSFFASAFAINHGYSGKQTRVIAQKHSGRISLSTMLPRLGMAINDVDDKRNLETSQLAQLASMTVLSIDSGDLKVIQQYADTGYITDATTNPLFVSQAGLSGDPLYASMVDQAVRYAIQETASATGNDESETVSLAIDRLAVLLGKAIADIVPGYVSTEVDPRLSFDTEASISRALRIIAMYKDLGVPKERILIKLAATWEGIQAAEALERDHGIQCNLTLIFSVVQAIACAQYGAHLISPFPGRILDWYKVSLQRSSVTDPEIDEGVIACKEMYRYFKTHGHDTICMPASWRPSRGSGYELDEIRALAGTDRMTIPPPLLEKLAASNDTLERKLSPENVQPIPLVANGKMDEKEFRYRLTMDGCGNDKLAEGIRSFVELTEKLDAAIREKVQAAVPSSA
jgi:transaldolase